MTIGSIDDSKYEGEITWIPLIEELLGYWEIKIDEIRLGDEPIVECDPYCKGAVDTGTSLLAAPSAALRHLYSMLDLGC